MMPFDELLKLGTGDNTSVKTIQTNNVLTRSAQLLVQSGRQKFFSTFNQTENKYLLTVFHFFWTLI